MDDTEKTNNENPSDRSKGEQENEEVNEKLSEGQPDQFSLPPIRLNTKSKNEKEEYNKQGTAPLLVVGQARQSQIGKYEISSSLTNIKYERKSNSASELNGTKASGMTELHLKDVAKEIINIVVIGERHVGKSKLINVFMEKSFDDPVPVVLPISPLPPRARILDTSNKPNDREDLADKVALANVIVLCYSLDVPNSVYKIRKVWLPFLKTIHEKNVPPVILVGLKDDKRKDTAEEKMIIGIINDFDEIETFLPVSAYLHFNVNLVFIYALQLYFQREISKLKEEAEQKFSNEITFQLENVKSERVIWESKVKLLTDEKKQALQTAEENKRLAEPLISKHQGDLDEITATFEREKQLIAKAHENEIARINIALRASEHTVEERMRKKYEKRIEELRTGLQKTMRAQNEEHRKRCIQYEIERDDLTKKYTEERIDQASKITQLTRECDNLRVMKMQTIEQYELKSQQMLQKFRREMQEEKEQHEVEKEALRINTERKLLDEQQRQKAALNTEAARKAMVETERAAQERNDVNSVKTLLMQKVDQITKLEARIRELENHAHRRTADYESLLDTKMKLETRIEELSREMAENRILAKSELATALREKEDRLRRENEILLQDITQQADTLREESLRKVVAERDALSKKFLEMSDYYAKELQKYALIESCPEDLDRIAQLESTVASLESDKKKIMDENHYLKMELQNREQNYNKVFGAQPKIGVMDVVSKMHK